MKFCTTIYSHFSFVFNYSSVKEAISEVPPAQPEHTATKR